MNYLQYFPPQAGRIFADDRMVVTCICFSADGSLAAVACSRGSVTIFDANGLQNNLEEDMVARSKPIQLIQVGYKVTALSWSHQATALAACFTNNPDVVIYNVHSGSNECVSECSSVAITLLRRGESHFAKFNLSTYCITHVHKRAVRCNERKAFKQSMICLEDVVVGCANGHITGWCLPMFMHSTTTPATSMQPSWSVKVSRSAVIAVGHLKSDYGVNNETLSYVLLVASSAGELSLWEVPVAMNAGSQPIWPLRLKTIDTSFRIVGAVPIFYEQSGCESCCLRAQSVLRKEEKKKGRFSSPHTSRKPTACRVQGGWPEVLVTGSEGQVRVYDNLGSASTAAAGSGRFRCVRQAGSLRSAALPAAPHARRTLDSRIGTNPLHGEEDMHSSKQHFAVFPTACGYLESYALHANQPVVSLHSATRLERTKSDTYSTQLPGHVLTATTGSCVVTLPQTAQALLCDASAAPMHTEKSHELQFDWAPLLPSAAVATVVTTANHSVKMMQNGTIILQEPYLGPFVRAGEPKVRLFTKLSTKIVFDRPRASTLQPLSQTQQPFVTAFSGWQVSALAAHPHYPFLVVGVNGKGIYLLDVRANAVRKKPCLTEDMSRNSVRRFTKINCSMPSVTLTVPILPAASERQSCSTEMSDNSHLFVSNNNACKDHGVESNTVLSVRIPSPALHQLEARLPASRVQIPRAQKRTFQFSTELLQTFSRSLKKAKKNNRHRELLAQDVHLRNSNNALTRK